MLNINLLNIEFHLIIYLNKAIIYSTLTQQKLLKEKEILDLPSLQTPTIW